MSELKLFVQGDPVPQPRVKARNNGGKVFIYTPKDADVWKKAITIGLLSHPLFTVITDCSVYLTLGFVLERPAGHLDSYGSIRTTENRCFVKPDIDNLIKAVMDAISTSGLWKDDSMVQTITASKEYISKERLYPGVDITIRW